MFGRQKGFSPRRMAGGLNQTAWFPYQPRYSTTGLDASWYLFHFPDFVHLLRKVYIRLAKYLVRLLYQVRNGWSDGFRQTQPTLRYFKVKLSDSPLYICFRKVPCLTLPIRSLREVLPAAAYSKGREN